MKSYFLAIFALAVTMVYGQANPVYITAPLAGASYTAGSTVEIRWINPTAETITEIVLSQGISTNIQPVKTVASNVATAAGSYSWTIPADLPAGNNYAFALGTSPDVAYTGQFTINAASGDAPASASGSSAAASGSASASAPASASVSASASAVAPAASSVASVVSKPSVAPSASKPASASRSATSPTGSPSVDSAAMSTKASMCAVAMTAFAALALM